MLRPNGLGNIKALMDSHLFDVLSYLPSKSLITLTMVSHYLFVYVHCDHRVFKDALLRDFDDPQFDTMQGTYINHYKR